MNEDRTASCKLNRVQLIRSSTHELRHILRQLEEQVVQMNAQLVQLLVEKDALHMCMDSLLVDVEDVLEQRYGKKSEHWALEWSRLGDLRRMAIGQHQPTEAVQGSSTDKIQ